MKEKEIMMVKQIGRRKLISGLILVKQVMEVKNDFK